MKNKTGYSLLELVLVLGIIATLIASSFIIYSKVSTSMKVNKEIKNISTVLEGISSIYKGKTDLSNITTEVVINAKLVPNDMLIPGNTGWFLNTWAGIVSVGANSNYNVGDMQVWDAVVIYEYGIPYDACVKFSKTIYDKFAVQQSLLKVMSINSTSVFFNVGYNTTAPSVSMEDIITACEKEKVSSIGIRVSL